MDGLAKDLTALDNAKKKAQDKIAQVSKKNTPTPSSTIKPDGKPEKEEDKRNDKSGRSRPERDEPGKPALRKQKPDEPDAADEDDDVEEPILRR